VVGRFRVHPDTAGRSAASPGHAKRHRFGWLLLALPAVGCATIIDNGPDLVTFTSDPTGATVQLDGRAVGTTPVDADVERKAKAVTFDKDGFRPETLKVPRNFNEVSLGNILFGGLVGFFVDWATNSIMEADTEVHANLREGSS